MVVPESAELAEWRDVLGDVEVEGDGQGMLVVPLGPLWTHPHERLSADRFRRSPRDGRLGL